VLDEKTKALIKEHIDLHLNTAEAVLKGFETATTVNISDGAGWSFPITRDKDSIRRVQQIATIYRQLKDDYDAGNFDTDTMIILRETIASELPKKRAIRQNKNTNQLVLSILTPTVVTDKAKHIRKQIQIYEGGTNIQYHGCQKLNRQVQTDIMRFMDLWSENWGRGKTAELKFSIQDMMTEWSLNSYSSFRARLKNVAAAMTSIKIEAPAGGYVVPFPAVFIEQNTGYFVIRADQTLCKELESGSSALLMSPEYWLIDAHTYQYAPAILRKLTMQAQLNQKNNRRNVLHWKTLVRSLPHLPTEETIKKDQGRHYERIFEPLMSNMDYLKETHLIDWKHSGKDPENWQELMQGKFEWTVL
jgi:hypothetical protein